ncbi:monovalent cation/H(+) antiporter subunit G [Glycomyces xiaoerkulensis]|uniref:monovalent cation/H(+) antiporter subunit G n=1 Tax=Glycomyces xiaoerkulensis TaxID=2038139 RepID=UPI000C26929A|nr:monovalent cation/H(+) antiporter subunit G [Glycomyces xiaoerkulensis]
MNAWPVLSGVFLGLGVLLIAIASIGLVRLPDAYSRLNAVTKAATLALFLVLAGAWLSEPGWYAAVEATLAAWLLAVTAPAAGHAIGRALHRTGTPLGERCRYDERDEPRPDPGPHRG